jgi:hypothetical protein
VLGELVRDREVLFRSPSLTASLEHVRAYPEGFEFRISLRSRIFSLGPAWVGPVRVAPPMAGAGDAQVRVGLECADGTRLTNLAPVIVPTNDAPRPPLFAQLWAGDTGGRWDQRYWAWGLPPSGPLVVVIEAPGREIPETRVELVSDEIRTAARRAEVLWDEDDADHAGLGVLLPGHSLIFAPEPSPTGAPPADEAGARHEIEIAFARTQEIRGDDLIHVEGGDGLAPTVYELHRRFPGTAQTATHHVERVTFLSPTEASVWFSTWLGVSPYMPSHRGTAVVDNGRWKMSRATFCALLARVGVACPPT